MSSYNKIVKVKYSKSPEDVVALQEYIVFENTQAKEKYVVFKFLNNLNQNLLKLKFEVEQFNMAKEIIEKSVVLYDDCQAEPNASFVPSAKLKINYDCVALEVKLVIAAFDRIVWDNGEFQDNSYRFDSYAEKIARTSEPATQPEKVREKKEDKSKTKVKKNKNGFNIKNIFRKNKAVFPSILNVFMALVFIGLVIGSTFYFKAKSKDIYVEGFSLTQLGGDTVAIKGYDGTNPNVVITSNIGKYTVSEISSGAFKKSSKVTSVEFKTEIAIRVKPNAFNGCKKLTKITSADDCSSVILMENAVKGCTSLSVVYLPTGLLYNGCFNGSANIKELTFMGPMALDGNLLTLFGNIESIVLRRLEIINNVPEDYTVGVTVIGR